MARTIVALGVGSGNFCAERLPDVSMRGPNPFWYLSTVHHGDIWLWRQF